ncbi:hypothetical protein IEQ34_026887 [Dendrobium chrysotoxum]|uniref:Uncharacterized protein n=1 Tax=Dendrobium chrysotoxum TaxID=161865 RepID=A0AAV7FIC9_DENCH|nr:hypothetical protein IEQ34_026887 [Dendrobium chrysotoxum]
MLIAFLNYQTNLDIIVQYRPGRYTQQGGILVAGPGTSNISYLHKDKEAGDDPNVEDVLQACCS